MKNRISIKSAAYGVVCKNLHMAFYSENRTNGSFTVRWETYVFRCEIRSLFFSQIFFKFSIHRMDIEKFSRLFPNINCPSQRIDTPSRDFTASEHLQLIASILTTS